MYLIYFKWQYLSYYINPNIFSTKYFQLRWYSIMYIISCLITYLLVLNRIKFEKKFKKFNKSIIQEIYFIGLIGLLIGGRIGYIILYNIKYYFSNPLEIILPFNYINGFVRFIGISGMSYHGAIIGIVIIIFIYCKFFQINFWQLADLICPTIPLGYTFGRIGNFLNGELFGRKTTVFWGMYFLQDKMQLLRHPSQLYEAFFEGIILFFPLWLLRKKNFPAGSFLAFYLIGYGFIRFIIEFFREPDIQIGFIYKYFTMGQLLSIIMIIIGILIILKINYTKDVITY